MAALTRARHCLTDPRPTDQDRTSHLASGRSTTAPCTLLGELNKRIDVAREYYRSLDIAERDIRDDFFAAEADEKAVDAAIKDIAAKRAKTVGFLDFKGMSIEEADALRNQLSKSKKNLLARLTVAHLSGKIRAGLGKDSWL